MNVPFNIDLLSFGLIFAANIIIGVVTYDSDKKSVTNRLFFTQTLILSLWSLANYLSYQVKSPALALVLVRLVLCLGVANSVNFLVLMHTFPSRTLNIDRKTVWLLSITSAVIMIITLTPLVFNSVTVNAGSAPTPVVNSGVIPFLLIAILPIPFGLYYLLRNYKHANVQAKGQFAMLALGVILMFLLIFVLVIVLPVFFSNSRFIPLSSLLTFPFVICTAYAIYKHGLFNIKVTFTALLVFLLSIAMFVEIVFADTIPLILFRSSVFILVLIFGISLVRGVLEEVKTREKIQSLADNLREANVKLTNIDKQKSEFVSFATHQLRSPLTAMKGYTSLLLEGDYGKINPEATEALKRIYESSQTLTSVIDDYLNISRIELGTMKYMFKVIDLKSVVTTVIREVQPTVTKAGLSLIVDYDKSQNFVVRADPDKMRQVISNLIDNSIKYTPKGGLRIGIDRRGDKVLFSIKDSGIGMQPKIIPSLFQKFTRANNASEVNIRGTGLGLYVAREIVVAHGGRIWAESEGEGKGSQFYVELPTSTGSTDQPDLHTVDRSLVV